MDNSQLNAIVEPGSAVELFFSLALVSGEVIDSNFDGSPASFRLGDGSMLPGFEQILLGLKVGEETTEKIEAKDAFGEPNPQNRQRFPVARFEHLLEDDLIPTKVGSVISFRDPGGFDLPGVIVRLDEKYVEVDFNHPLAGKDILFRARIVSILPADEKPINIQV